MKYLSLIIIVLIAISCKKDSEATLIDSTVFFDYRNIANENLLDPIMLNAIKTDDIDTYVLIKGVKVKINDARMSAPENFRIFKSEIDGYFVQFNFPTEHIENNKVTCFIKLNSGREDQIAAEFVQNGSSTYYTKVWINGILAWSDPEPRTKRLSIVIP
jgi:hypothetical protein